MVFAACALVSMLMPCHGWSANHAETLLKGKVIGTMYGYDYTTGQSSSSVNTKENAFDGNPAARQGPEGSFNAWRMSSPPRARRIDFIYYRGKGVVPLSYRCNNRLYDGGYPSDHFPVVVKINLEAN